MFNKLTVAQLVKKFAAFLKVRTFIALSRTDSVFPCPKPDLFSQHPHTQPLPRTINSVIHSHILLLDLT
jgi:hypothetical protein